MCILLVDNYDSFVHNLARYFQRLGKPTVVARNDSLTVRDVERLEPEAIILSPGPCTPREAGVSLDVVRTFHRNIPMLGVCLGHQAIGEAFGGRVIRAPRPIHGQVSQVTHAEKGLLQGIPNPFAACRYHSLVIDPVDFPACLEQLAWTNDGLIMALRHREYSVMGVQFHPESILTAVGYEILAGFLRCAGLGCATEIPTLDDELRVPVPPPSSLPAGPVTF